MNNRHFIFFLFFVLSFFHAWYAWGQSATPIAQKGVLDLRKTDFYNDPINLKGEWRFYWQEFRNHTDLAHTKQISKINNDSRIFINAPSRWSNESIAAVSKESFSESISSMGHATYTLKILINDKQKANPISFRISNMSSSYELYIDNRLFAQNGVIGTNPTNTTPEYRRLVRTYMPQKNEIHLKMMIANYHDPNSGGFWKPIWIGSEKAISTSIKKALAFDLFLLGALVIMSFYHFGLFILRNEDKSSLAFASFTLIISIRILFTGELLAMDIFPTMSWQTRAKWEFLSFYLGMPVLNYFLYSLFPKEFHIKILYATTIISSLFAIDVLIHPMAGFGPRLHWFQAIALFMILYTLICMSFAIYRKREGSVIFLIGLLFFFATVIFDIAMSHFGTYDFITPFGLFVFIFSQSFILSLLFSRAYKSVQVLSNRLSHTNISYQRFVPQKLLSLLNKEDITLIELGEQIQADMPVLFSDIRSFTRLSESMNPTENFNFLNSYLKRMGPIIRSHNGFIDKYLGDGIMALFPGGNENALIAAIEMLKELKEYNIHRRNINYPPIRIGIGLHRGKLMLGTIGESERMDATVISDSVNTASRIENLTKTFGCSLLISGEFFSGVENPDKYDYRVLGKVKIRGKNKTTDIIEIFNEDEESLKQLKRRNLKKFNDAISAYLNKNYETAHQLFSQIIVDIPDDQAAHYYHNLLESSERPERLS